LSSSYKSKLYNFKLGSNSYDGKELSYLYAIINKKELKLKPFQLAKKIEFDKPPTFVIENLFPIAANELLEYITNFNYRKHWVDEVVDFEFNHNEVNRIGTEHICVIKDKHLNFTTITKQGKSGQLVYGEMSTSPPPVDVLYQFHTITPITNTSCSVETEVYIEARSLLKKLVIFLFVKNAFKKGTTEALLKLRDFIDSIKQ